MSKVQINPQIQMPISMQMHELIEDCKYTLDHQSENMLFYISECSTKKLKFSTGGFVSFEQYFEAEEDRSAVWSTVFTCSLQYNYSDTTLALILQSVKAIDVTSASFVEYKVNNPFHLYPGGNAGYFGHSKQHRATA